VKSVAKYVGCTAAASVMALAITSSPAAAQDAGNVEVSGGYQFNRLSPSDCGGSDCSLNANGWYADVAGPISPMLSWVGVVDGVYKEEDGETLKVHSYGGGIRISSKKSPKVTPFGQITIGGATASGFGDSISAFALTLGGGVNVPVNDKWGVRAQADYRGIFFDENDGGRVDGARIVVGAYFALGK